MALHHAQTVLREKRLCMTHLSPLGKMAALLSDRSQHPSAVTPIGCPMPGLTQASAIASRQWPNRGPDPALVPLTPLKLYRQKDLQSNWKWTDNTRSTHKKSEKSIQNFNWKSWRKKALVRYKMRGCKLDSCGIKLLGSTEGYEFLEELMTISFSRRTVFHNT
jgi:hypothetical protein